MATELSQCMQELKITIERLPELPANETAEAEAAVAAQQHATAALDALRAELAGAEAKVAQLQHAHGVLADVALAQPPPTAPPPPPPPPT